MTEFEKMRHGVFYDYTNDEVNASNVKARQLCARLQTMTLEDKDYRKVMEELIPGIPASTIVNPPFHCDHGHGIRLGENVFINYNATMLDGGMITIGDNCQIGPNCQLVTPNHPIDYMERRKPIERCLPINIGNDCWLGAGVIICPGVTIGDRCVIGAGSVVVKDIPADSMAVGNPARVIKKLVSENKDERFQALLEDLLKTFNDKGYSAEDFYGGCTLCGDANEFALDIIDAAVKRAVPDIAQEDLNKTSDRLYRELHKLLSEMNND